VISVLSQLCRLVLSFPGVVSSIPNPVLHLGIPVLCVLCELIGVTVSPKWDLRIKLFLLSRSSFLNRFPLSKVLLRRHFSPRASPILGEVAISSLFRTFFIISWN
jgi:hypothetical protein